MHEKETFFLSISSYREVVLEAATIHKYRIFELYTIYGVQKFDKMSVRGKLSSKGKQAQSRKRFSLVNLACSNSIFFFVRQTVI